MIVQTLELNFVFCYDEHDYRTKCIYPVAGNQKMAKVVNLELDDVQDSSSRYEVLAWLNNKLQTKFTKIEEICSGMFLFTVKSSLKN